MTVYDALEVHIELAGRTVLAGRAQFHRSRGNLTSTTFQYEAAYLAHALAYQLDPALRLVTGTQQTHGLPGAFSDSAPDRWGRDLIKKRERALALHESRSPRNFDDADFLAGVSDITRQGALRYRVDISAGASTRANTASSQSFLDPGHDVPRLLSLPELVHAADTAARSGHTGYDDYEAVKALLAAGTGSLGGARPKAAVLDNDGHQLIAKFPHHEDAWDVMAWEATALDLAALAGVVVPARRLVRVEQRHVLLLNRFDRADSRSTRIGYTSAMSMLGRRDGDHADYVDIADSLAEVSAQAKEDARQLFRRVAVSVGLNNTDDHLRNHGFLRGRGGWMLSPAFDVNPNPDPAPRQTTIAGADTPADEAAGLMELGRSCRLSAAEARDELTLAAEAISRWKEVALRNGVPQSQLARFEDSFQTGLSTLHST